MFLGENIKTYPWYEFNATVEVTKKNSTARIMIRANGQTCRFAVITWNQVDRFAALRTLIFTGTTMQVIFSDTSGSPDISAVQADEASTYKAEETSFVGFAGEVRRNSLLIHTISSLGHGLLHRLKACAMVIYGKWDGREIKYYNS